MEFQKGNQIRNTGKTRFKKGFHPKAEFKKGHTINFERVWKKESRDKLSESNKGKHHSPESEFKKGKLPQRDFSESRNELLKILNLENKYGLGFKQTPEALKKIKEARARQILPIKDTTIEVKIQNYLRALGVEFYTHQFMPIEHSYCCDIIIPSKKLVIETDGTYFHNYPFGNEIDNLRTKELTEKGYRVIRIWGSDIKQMNLERFQEVLQ